MVYNTSQTQINNAAARDLALKLKLEYQFKKDLSAFFNKLNKVFKQTYIESGQIVPANIFQNDLRKILEANYRRITKQFSSQMRMGIKSFYNIETKNIDNDITNQLNGYINTQSLAMAKDITQTNQDEMGNTVTSVKNEAALNGTLLTQAQVATAAFTALNNKSASRITTIATTETQKLAELSKFVEADNISRNADIPELRDSFTIKQWVTVLDERTRASHVIADGQQKNINQPFNVANQSMMVPGDTSLGASLESTINCRCSSIYTTQSPTFRQRVQSVVDQTARIQPRDDLYQEFTIKGEPRAKVRGFAVTYDQLTSDKDAITRQAIENGLKKLKDKGNNIILMYEMHETSRKTIGYFRLNDMVSTKHGLYVEGIIDTSTDRGKEILAKIRDGKLRGMSVGTDAKMKYIKERNGVLRITDFDLDEISLVDTGAVPGTDLLPMK